MLTIKLRAEHCNYIHLKDIYVYIKHRYGIKVQKAFTTNSGIQ